MAGRRKVGQENIRSLTKVSSGKSYAVTLPKEMIKKLGWKERQKLVVTQKGKSLIIKDWKR
jgi:antitoxin component of MazEF toxin-antitoxin module